MANIRLTLVSKLFGAQSEQNVGIRTDIPVEDLIVDIRAEFKLSESDSYALVADNGRLAPQQTLAEAGVREASRLHFVSLGKQKAALQAPNGQKFELRKQKTIIGRLGSTQPPDIDLGPFDPSNYSSRPHTEIVVDNGGYYLSSLRIENPTFINDRSVESNKPLRLKDKDRIRFGRNPAAPVFLFVLTTVEA